MGNSPTAADLERDLASIAKLQQNQMRRYESNMNLLRSRNRKARSLRSVNSEKTLARHSNFLSVSSDPQETNMEDECPRNKFLQKTYSSERGLLIYKLKETID